jgi:hypothetical protein
LSLFTACITARNPSAAGIGSTMKNITITRRLHLRLALAFIHLTVLLMVPSSHAITLEALRSRLPDKVADWSRARVDQIYTPQTIFDYINGGAEVYKAYNMRRCLSRQYTTARGPVIMLDVFDMGTSEDAYGVFTHDPAGDVLQLGQDGRLRPGWANFWKDRYFVSIYAEEETDAAQNAVQRLAEQVAALIAGRGNRPQILKRLPPQGLQADSIRFLHHPVILNYHYYLSDENLLNLSAQTDAVLAAYRRDQGQALMLLIAYPGPAAAAGAHANFKRHYLADAAKNGVALLENRKWSALAVKGRLLLIVLEADSRPLAENLLETVDLVE